ncbi:VOC family protein [Arthrobacter sp. KK5.5]|uniref:VOC family protein n=1 Tax=Arthrobacter sp. KK5.5 TaxID=3373084 RepID=UPI003EE5700D
MAKFRSCLKRGTGKPVRGAQLRREEPGWVMIGPPDGGVGLSFQAEPGHVPPAWPSRAGEQQMQAHLDLLVDGLLAAGARAERLGAGVASVQPQRDVRVYLDPAGHPFCLFEG